MKFDFQPLPTKLHYIKIHDGIFFSDYLTIVAFEFSYFSR